MTCSPSPRRRVLQIHSADGENVTILDVGRATLELSNPAQVAMIDRVEVGHRRVEHADDCGPGEP